MVRGLIVGFILGYGLAVLLYSIKQAELFDKIFQLKAKLYELQTTLKKKEEK
jgi:hypothetical protein